MGWEIVGLWLDDNTIDPGRLCVCIIDTVLLILYAAVYVCFSGDTFTPLYRVGFDFGTHPVRSLEAVTPLQRLLLYRLGDLLGHTLSNYSGVKILPCYHVMCIHPFFF